MKTAVLSNAQPRGGTTATQPVPTNMTPADIAALVEQMIPAVARFRQQSSPLSVPLDTQSPTGAGWSQGIRIASVGLGYMIVTHWSLTFTLANTAGGAQVVNFSTKFPYNCVLNSSVAVNGGATVYTASGLPGLLVAGRTRRGFFAPSLQGAFGWALNPALVQMTISNATVTNGAVSGINGNFPLAGVASISIAAGQTATVVVDFFSFEKLALDRDSLLGALPLQNNATYATLTRTLQPSFGGGNNESPFWVAGGIPGTLAITLANASSVKSTYYFWSVPPDPGLYQEMVTNSYQVQEQTNLTFAATGVEALSYNIPQNQYLVAAHIMARDNNGAALAPNALTFARVKYNAGGVIPVQIPMDRQRALQYSDYGADIFALPGCYLWDGDETTEALVDTDQAGWVDAYAAATPQITADVAAAVVTPVTYSITRESVVAGAVQVVGG